MEQSGDTSEVSTALKSIDLNSTENTGCFLCQKPNPVKKCSKSHSRCKGKLFCDKNCEMSLHKSEKTKVLNQCTLMLRWCLSRRLHFCSDWLCPYCAGHVL